MFPLLVLVAAVGGHLFLGSAQHRRETVDAIVSVLPLSSSGAANVRRLVLTATSSSGAFSALSAIGVVWASAPVALLFFVYLSAIVVLWCAHLAAHLDQASARLRDTPTRRSSASARLRTRPSRMSRHGSAEISRRRW